jgi:hypothetical protein
LRVEQLLSCVHNRVVSLVVVVVVVAAAVIVVVVNGDRVFSVSARPCWCVQPAASAPVVEPAFAIEDMDGLVPDDAANNVSMDMRAVIARVVDASVLHEFKPEFGATVMTGE